MTVTIDKDRALELLRAAVAERGADYLYRWGRLGKCVYHRDGQPSCLVGLALAKAGVSIPTLGLLDSEADGALSTSAGSEGFSAVLLEAGFAVSPQAGRVFSRAQEVQDNGYLWGEALARAEGAVFDV